jgi:hypothetical protein
VSGSAGFGLQGGFDDTGNVPAFETSFASSAGGDVPNAADPALDHPAAPQRHGSTLNTEGSGNVLIQMPASSKEEDLGAEDDLLRRGTGLDPLLEARGFVVGKKNRGGFAWHPAMLLTPMICVVI